MTLAIDAQDHSNKWDEWLTPPHILRALGSFDLDPCAPANRPWDTAAEHISLPDNGLAVPWHGRVWLNPPYGNHTDKWVRKLIIHGEGTLLVFARTDTHWFQRAADAADSFLFLRGRLRFHDSAGVQRDSASCGSVLFAFGAADARRLVESELDGVLCTGKLKRSTSLFARAAGED